MFNDIFEKNLKLLSQPEIISALSGIKRGIEKECLRINKKSNCNEQKQNPDYKLNTDQNHHRAKAHNISPLPMIAMTPHPKGLGSNLTHPMITTDYSEALLEFVTPPLNNIQDLFENLKELHQFTYHVLKDEYLWAMSMPCHLPEETQIPIAQYGHSNIGLLKYYYRVGLGHRYGKRMQMIAGVHYNFSFSPDFFRIWQQVQENTMLNQASPNFISESYLALIRNVLRLGWFLPLLFGASPAIAKSFIHPSILTILESNLTFDAEFQFELESFRTETLKEDPFKRIKSINHTIPYTESLILPEATSLRLSDLGYHNKEKPLVEVSYNSFPELLKTLHLAVHSQDPEFAKIGVKVNREYRQLSDCVLQVEDEHYAMVRPKRMTGPGERMFAALEKNGIEYIEVRALDLNPFSPYGIEPESVHILDIFLLTCFLMDSPPLSKKEMNNIGVNQQKVAKEGRKPGLKLISPEGEERLLVELCNDILKAMEVVASCLDKAYGEKKFSEAMTLVRYRLSDFNTLPSARILNEMFVGQESYCQWASRWSHQHERYIQQLPWDKKRADDYLRLAEQSLREQETLEKNSQISFDEYLKNFLQL